MLLECHTLTMNTIVLQLSDAVADISMLQCSAQFRILTINAHFVVDNATHALATAVGFATAKPTFNVEEEDVVIRNGWTPKDEDLNRINHPTSVESASGLKTSFCSDRNTL